MDIEEFNSSIKNNKIPAGLSPFLIALWHDARGDWEQAHSSIQDVEGVDAAWVHAYLHRKEGDIGNADYWYRRAGRTRPSVSLEEESIILTRHFLSSSVQK